ncbi:MAG: hypothetical protein IPG02_02790 [Ignavibacteria bacterium]|nr:hypothetical protein [Ignavibacteria bacterium]
MPELFTFSIYPKLIEITKNTIFKNITFLRKMYIINANIKRKSPTPHFPLFSDSGFSGGKRFNVTKRRKYFPNRNNKGEKRYNTNMKTIIDNIAIKKSMIQLFNLQEFQY